MGITRSRWLLPLLALIVAVSAEDGVQLFKSGLQTVTSSTLHWVPHTIGSKMPNYTISAGDNPVVHPGQEQQHPGEGRVCRANVNGVWVCGEAAGGRCRVSLLGEVRQDTRHQLLQAVGGGARLLWKPWNRFTVPLPAGTVAAATDTYIARRRVTGEDGEGSGRWLLGKATVSGISGRLTAVDTNGEEEEFADGDVLVEMEPERYELSGVRLQLRRRRVTRRETRVLATAVLRNGAGRVRMRADAELAYDYEHALYWGQGRGMFKGLNTTVRADDGSLVDSVRWGLQDASTVKRLFTAEYMLEPGTAVNVTLLGNMTEEETPYEGMLVAFYGDGQTLARPFPGVLNVVELRDVRAEYGDVYFLSNNTLVPTTTTTTTSTTTTTTTSTTTTTAAPVPEKKGAKPEEAKEDAATDNEVSKWPSDEGTAGGEQSSLKKDEEEGAKKEHGAGAGGNGAAVATPQGVHSPLLAVAVVAALQRIVVAAT